MQALYTHEDHAITAGDFLDALRKTGIENGDTIFVHSDIKVFGKITIGDKAELMRALVSVLEECVGPEGTVVMPAFSYSFCKGEVFDTASSRSTVGALTDFFRTEPGVGRSIHPIFSVGAWGAHRKDFMRTTKDSFGEGTVFDTLRQKDGKIVLFGTDFQACTFLHYIEQMHEVPYRFMKTFEGTIVDGSASYRDAYTYFVRPLDGTIENDFTVIEAPLRRRGLLREARVGNGVIFAVGADDLYDEGMRILDREPYFFVAQSDMHSGL